MFDSAGFNIHLVIPYNYLNFQVDLSDSESEEPGTESAEKEDAMGRRKGDLGVNKKGTPLYSREDIREQYCINDKELQVLDKTGRKGILGCFSNNGQVCCATKNVILIYDKQDLAKHAAGVHYE